VFSVELLDLLSPGPGPLDPAAARLVAQVLRARGQAAQVGREVQYRHANFRFLGYLAAGTRDQKVAEEIRGYQAEVARTMKLAGWEEVP
jgi:hypothetical protein